MRKILFEGEGTNLKTGKKIRFQIPDTMSVGGLEGLMKNISPVDRRSFILAVIHIIQSRCPIKFDITEQDLVEISYIMGGHPLPKEPIKA